MRDTIGSGSVLGILLGCLFAVSVSGCYGDVADAKTPPPNVATSTDDDSAKSSSERDVRIVEEVAAEDAEARKEIAAVLARVAALEAQVEALQKGQADKPARPRRPRRKIPDPAVTHAVPLGKSRVGARKPKVVIVEAFNYKCGHCKRALPTMHTLLSQYKDLAIVHKHIALWEGTRALHEASCAASLQGKFVAFDKLAWLEDKVGRNTEAGLGKKYAEKVARRAGIRKMRKFRRDRDGVCAATVKNDRREMANFGVRGTPGFFVNGRYMNISYMNIAEFKRVIDEELAKVNAAIKAGTAKDGPDYYQKFVLGAGRPSAVLIEAP